ncbi:hypothetical protein [Polyangium fumosum]|uniref:Uncharacterized protein n=1 Tax=Polyangium fumosum TaxID=889272 RepID=A0A4U1IVX8_9BACT|nr:hypothetical protein [Polyangium fumosum]TKC98583.1 hypothetical protein E8A74_40655 [Polyangium fumosum]
MPTLELYGYSSEEAERTVAMARALLLDLPFRNDIVFVLQGPTQVVAWDGSHRPFVRILTRSRERADMIKARLTRECDLEVVFIDFIPRTTN